MNHVASPTDNHRGLSLHCCHCRGRPPCRPARLQYISCCSGGVTVNRLMKAKQEIFQAELEIRILRGAPAPVFAGSPGDRRYPSGSTIRRFVEAQGGASGVRGDLARFRESPAARHAVHARASRSRPGMVGFSRVLRLVGERLWDGRGSRIGIIQKTGRAGCAVRKGPCAGPRRYGFPQT